MTDIHIKNYQDLTPEMVTSLYLYGTPKPSNTYTSYFKPDTKIIFDMKDYMLNGPGRYARASSAKFVKDFFTGKVKVENGSYTKETILRRLHPEFFAKPSLTDEEKNKYINGFFNFSLQQGTLDPESRDYKTRAYVHATTGFEISDAARLVVSGENRYIENMAVHSLDDDFDFDSDTNLNYVGNKLVLEPKIDPDGQGKIVLFEFSTSKSQVPTIPIYTDEDFRRDEAEVETIPTTNYLHVKETMDEVITDLYRSGVVVPQPGDISRENLSLLMNSPAYLNHDHPNYDRLHDAVRGWFERVYAPSDNDKRRLGSRGNGSVHVRAHTRESGKEQVKAYDRGRPQH